MKQSKRFRALAKQVDTARLYSIEEAVGKVKEMANAKFTESVDIAVRLGVDPKKADQAIRGTVALPHGTGKQVREIAEIKMPDLNANTVEAAMEMVAGTARSMGITVEG